MRIVFDSNVLVAAFATRGLCTELFTKALEAHTVVTSERILEETEKALRRKIRLPDDDVIEILSFLGDALEVGVPIELPAGSCRDPSDFHVLGLAVAAKAEVIVSGDPDILELGRFRGTSILSPRSLWERLEKTR